MTSSSYSNDTSGNHPLSLCRHFELLGVSAALKPSHDKVNIIHCSVCGLTFHVKSEGLQLLVTQIEPFDLDRKE
jgi:hypothetical protein